MARHTGNRPRYPACRILPRPRLRGPSGRGPRQRPAAARHRLIGLSCSACPASTYPSRCSMNSAPQTADGGIPMSEIDRDHIPSREEERLLKRALGSAIPGIIARLGAAGAVKRVEAELRRERRARSRNLYRFWSAVLARIDPGTKESSIRGECTARSPFGPRRGRQSHEGPAPPQRRTLAGDRSRRSASGHRRSGP